MSGAPAGRQEPAAPAKAQHAAGSGASRGAVTAEFAVTLPAVVALLALLLAGAAAGITQLRLEEGARAGARALARGEDPAAVERTVRTLAGGTATASVTAGGGWFTITVSDRVGGPLGTTIPWTLTARAASRAETGAATAGGGLAGAASAAGTGNPLLANLYAGST